MEWIGNLGQPQGDEAITPSESNYCQQEVKFSQNTVSIKFIFVTKP